LDLSRLSLHAKPRREWKDQAIAKIDQRLKNQQALQSEVDGLKASLAKWYYCTFHFCRDMITLRVTEEWQPTSLTQFIDAYLLVPFDGRSDECLKATWTGAEPFGLAKVQMAGTTNPAE
jgi:hypothetical protein